MKIRYRGILLMVSILLATSQWTCKNNSNVVGTGAPISAVITGVVVSSTSPTPLAGATVVLGYEGNRDSVVTGSNGVFQFVIDIPDTSSGVNVTLTVYETGYITYSHSFNVRGNQTFPVSLGINAAAYAVIKGMVQDSVSHWPLPGASVVVSLSGTASSTMKYLSYAKSHIKSVASFIISSAVTDTTGSFTLYIPFPDYLSSVTAAIAVSENGFIPYQGVKTFIKGTTENDTIRLRQNVTQSVAHIIGQVIDSHSLLPITNVSVILSSSLTIDSVKTSAGGNYSFNIDLPGASSSVSGTLLFRLNSYDDTTVNFSVNAGQTLTENVALSAKPTIVGGDSNTARGVARSISLISVSHQEISIHGVGKNETSVIVWQVLDSLGFPIDINHQDTVVFVPTGIPVTNDPTTSAYVTPLLGITDGSGEVSTTVNSGTVAGTIQLITKLNLSSGLTVQSSPVLITVNGGLPDQTHFELNSNLPHAANFAGYDWSEVTQGFTVQAGDKYANPVAPGTAIYFSTTAGIVTAAGQTDATGHANATLFSGLPLPKLSGLDPTYFGDGTGYAYVKAYTQGENGTIVADSDLICISASAAPILFNDSLSIAPVIVHDSIGVAYIRVHISDRFGNPLESGTTITSTVKVTPPPPTVTNITWSVTSSGMPSDDGGQGLGDYLTRGAGSTDFVLVVSANAMPSDVLVGSPLVFTVTVKVSGRNTGNGTISNTFTGVLVP